MRSMLYRVEGFGTPESPSGMGGAGFNIYLHQKFAEHFRKSPITDRAREFMQDDAREYIRKFDLGDGIENPYDFYDNSWLISGIRVPGNSTDISLDESSKKDLEEEYFERTLGYMPHNVDSMPQASCLAALFFHWANTADDMLTNQ